MVTEHVLLFVRQSIQHDGVLLSFDQRDSLFQIRSQNHHCAGFGSPCGQQIALAVAVGAKFLFGNRVRVARMPNVNLSLLVVGVLVAISWTASRVCAPIPLRRKKLLNRRQTTMAIETRQRVDRREFRWLLLDRTRICDPAPSRPAECGYRLQTFHRSSISEPPGHHYLYARRGPCRTRRLSRARAIGWTPD